MSRIDAISTPLPYYVENNCCYKGKTLASTRVTKTDLKQILGYPYRAALFFLALSFVLAFLIPFLNDNGSILDFRKFITAIKDAVPLMLMAVAAAFVLASGQVDLSTAGVASMAGVLWSLQTILYSSSMTAWAFLVTVCLCLLPLLVGGINGALSVGRRAPSLVVTWAVGSFLLIAAILVSKLVGDGLFGQNIRCVDGDTAKLCADVAGVKSALSYSRSHWTTVSGIMFLLAVSSFVYFMNRTLRMGRQCSAVGANYISATYLGLRVTVVERWAFFCSASCCTVAGILMAEYNKKAGTTNFAGDELTAIAIAVLGGTVLSGGYFSFLAIALSAYAWALISLLTKGYVGPGSDILGSRLPDILFPLVVIAFGAILGRRLSGHTRPVLVAYETKE